MQALFIYEFNLFIDNICTEQAICSKNKNKLTHNFVRHAISYMWRPLLETGISCGIGAAGFRLDRTGYLASNGVDFGLRVSFNLLKQKD